MTMTRSLATTMKKKTAMAMATRPVSQSTMTRACPTRTWATRVRAAVNRVPILQPASTSHRPLNLEALTPSTASRSRLTTVVPLHLCLPACHSLLRHPSLACLMTLTSCRPHHRFNLAQAAIKITTNTMLPLLPATILTARPTIPRPTSRRRLPLVALADRATRPLLLQAMPVAQARADHQTRAVVLASLKRATSAESARRGASVVVPSPQTGHKTQDRSANDAPSRMQTASGPSSPTLAVRLPQQRRGEGSTAASFERMASLDLRPAPQRRHLHVVAAASIRVSVESNPVYRLPTSQSRHLTATPATTTMLARTRIASIQAPLPSTLTFPLQTIRLSLLRHPLGRHLHLPRLERLPPAAGRQQCRAMDTAQPAPLPSTEPSVHACPHPDCPAAAAHLPDSSHLTQLLLPVKRNTGCLQRRRAKTRKQWQNAVRSSVPSKSRRTREVSTVVSSPSSWR